MVSNIVPDSMDDRVSSESSARLFLHGDALAIAVGLASSVDEREMYT